MAERYVAIGRVHPERADINFSEITWDIPNEGKVTASCSASQLTVALELNHIDGWVSAKITAEHFAYIIVGALGFATGSGYSVEVIQVIEENGTPHVIGVRPTGSSPNETLGFTPHDSMLNSAFKLANKNVFFRLALRDYLRAINDVVDCPTYCYRAIESIKSAFAYNTGKDGWETMHNALGTNKEVIENNLKKYADPIRHGNWIATQVTNKDDRWEMLFLTRNLLVKFIDYELSKE